MGTLLNYLFLGIAFTFVMDLLLSIENVRNHVAVEDKEWGMPQRILCVLIWPIAALVFFINFIKQFFN